MAREKSKRPFVVRFSPTESHGKGRKKLLQSVWINGVAFQAHPGLLTDIFYTAAVAPEHELQDFLTASDALVREALVKSRCVFRNNAHKFQATEEFLSASSDILTVLKLSLINRGHCFARLANGRPH